MYGDTDWATDHRDQGDKPNPERQDSLSYVEFMCGEHRQVRDVGIMEERDKKA